MHYHHSEVKKMECQKNSNQEETKCLKTKAQWKIKRIRKRLFYIRLLKTSSLDTRPDQSRHTSPFGLSGIIDSFIVFTSFYVSS